MEVWVECSFRPASGLIEIRLIFRFLSAAVSLLACGVRAGTFALCPIQLRGQFFHKRHLKTSSINLRCV